MRVTQNRTITLKLRLTLCQIITQMQILGSGATHHVTTDSDNLEEYTGNEEVSMSGGKAILIIHTDLAQTKASNSNFMLSNTLCSPVNKNNLSYVSKFCFDNLISLDFFHTIFLWRISKLGECSYNVGINTDSMSGLEGSYVTSSQLHLHQSLLSIVAPSLESSSPKNLRLSTE